MNLHKVLVDTISMEQLIAEKKKVTEEGKKVVEEGEDAQPGQQPQTNRNKLVTGYHCDLS